MRPQGDADEPSAPFGLGEPLICGGLGMLLLDQENHVQTDQAAHHQGNQHNVVEEKPRDRLVGRKFPAKKKTGRQVPYPGNRSRYEKADGSGGDGEFGIGQQVAGKGGHERCQHQDQSHPPVDLPRVAVGTREIDPEQVGQQSRDHELRGPVMDVAHDLAEEGEVRTNDAGISCGNLLAEEVHHPHRGFVLHAQDQSGAHQKHETE